MKAKVRQCLSDVMIQRKRDARNAFFGVLGYEYLRSRTSCITEESKKVRDEELKLVKSRLLIKLDNANPDSDIRVNTGRTAPDDVLKKNSVCDRGEAHGDVQEYVESPNALELPKNNVSKSVMELFTGFDLTVVEHYPNQYNETDDRNVRGAKNENSIMVFAKLDAWIVTVIEVFTPMLFVADKTDEHTEQNTGASRIDSPVKTNNGPGYSNQKLYADKYAKNILKPTDQLIGEIRSFMMLWAPTEVTPFCAKMGDEEEKAKSINTFLDIERSSTSLFDIPSERSVAISFVLRPSLTHRSVV